jgi:Mg2+ and Co2+ transporter CorA
MINSFYYHGADTLATGLTVPQIKAARHDAAGSLWIDLQAPTAQETDQILVGGFGFNPLTLSAWNCGLAVSGLTTDPQGIMVTTTMPSNGDGPGSAAIPESSCLGIHVASNSLVTVHQEAIPAIGAMLATVQSDISLIAAGPDRVAAELLLHSAGSRLAESAALRSRLEAIERKALGRVRSSGLRELHVLQGELAVLRQEAAAQADVARGMAEAAGPHVHEANRVYFRTAHQQLAATVARTAALEERADRLVTMQLPLAAGRLQSAVRLLAIIVAVLLAAVLIGLYLQVMR